MKGLFIMIAIPSIHHQTIPESINSAISAVNSADYLRANYCKYTQQDIREHFKDKSNIFEYSDGGKNILKITAYRYDLYQCDIQALYALLSLNEGCNAPLFEIIEAAYTAGIYRGTRFEKNKHKKNISGRKAV